MSASRKPSGAGGVSASGSGRLPRVPKGKRPKYFEPATDHLLNMVLALAGEVSVMRDRLETVERLIQKHGLFDLAEIETYTPTETERQARADRRAAYLARIMRTLQEDIGQPPPAATGAAGDG